MTSGVATDPSGPAEVPVVVIGGGPVGLALARELAQHGVGSTVIEPRATVSVERPRAKTTSARTMELFRRWVLARTLRQAAPIAPDRLFPGLREDQPSLGAASLAISPGSALGS